MKGSTLEQELDLAKLMVKDLDKLWKSYAKKALEAKQEKKGFCDCETKEELIDLYGYAEIDDDTYRRGLDYFDSPKKPNLSLIELHRQNVRELLDRWRGTIKEIEDELAPPEHKETVFERLDREEREAKAEYMRGQEALAQFYK